MTRSHRFSLAALIATVTLAATALALAKLIGWEQSAIMVAIALMVLGCWFGYDLLPRR